ncbi:type IV secretion system protein [Carnobacterium maltaromaticum]|uniref:type IV secretion system protein n=1 Tax=Carnobacterium maltaromaticum TaxID=2751 RepID=UPI0012FA0B2C|nr:type IV secretion system protein [Carnobacterium maltaromaticum]
MNIPESTLNQLFKGLQEYNPTTNDIMNKIAIVLQPLGIAIVGILFMMELTNYSKKFNQEDGGLTAEVLANIAVKYLIAFLLIMGSSYMMDAILWFGIQASKWIDSVITTEAGKDVIPAMAKTPLWARPLVFLFQIIAYIFLWLSEVVTNILIFLRSIQLYIVKAIAPILIAFFVHDELRSIAVGYFKYVMALALQGALLVLIIGLIPILTKNDVLSLSYSGAGAGAIITNVMTYIALIFKYIAIIVVLISSQNMAKRFMGAM